MTKDKLVRVYEPFEKNAKRLFPYKSMLNVTKEINKILEEMIYGKQKR